MKNDLELKKLEMERPVKSLLEWVIKGLEGLLCRGIRHAEVGMYSRAWTPNPGLGTRTVLVVSS